MAVNLKLYRGKKLWQIDFQDQWRRRIFEWCPPGVTKTEATRLWKQRQCEVAARAYRNERSEQRRGGTVQGFVKVFLKNYVGQKGKPRSDYYEQQARYIVKHWKATPLASIDRTALDVWRAKLETKVSSSTARKIMLAFTTMLEAAKDWNYIDVNPLAGVPKPPEINTPNRDFTPDEWERILDETDAAEDRAPWELPLYLLTLVTAARRQEILALKWEDIEDGFMYLTQGKTGTKRKKVPVGKVASAALAALEPNRFVSSYVFAVKRVKGREREGNQQVTWEPLNGNHVSKVFMRRLAAAGVKSNHEGRAVFASLRPTASTWVVGAGHTDIDAALLLGHALCVGVTRRYIHLSTVPAGVVETLDGLADRNSTAVFPAGADAVTG